MKKKIISLLLAAVMLCGIMPTAFAASDEATAAAEALYELGLFKGTGTNSDGTPIFDLDKTPTRNQAIIMLIRLLGKEEEALEGTWSIPFTDVTDNMKPYIGYAYTNGLTNGYTATTYCGTNPIKANQYIAFVLRALGYESGADFEVATSYTLSDTLGITNGEYSGASAFTRGDVAMISYKALSAPKKDAQPDPAPAVPEEKTLDLQGYWLGVNKTSDGSQFIECYLFSGNDYSCAYRCFDANDNPLFTAYEEGTFTFADSVLTLNKTAEYFYAENSAKTQTSAEKKTMSYTVAEYDGTVVFNNWGYIRFDKTESTYNQFKDYVMAHNESSGSAVSANSADYAYIAGNVFRDIRREHPHAVAQCAYVYAYTDLNGDLCVLTDVRYKIVSNWSAVVLYNVTKGTQVTDPVDYYGKQANRAYGANKIHYMELQNEVQGNHVKMLSAMSSMLKGGANTFGGVFVDAAVLNQ
ncbi:S-layer homology domain-containing protein [Dysosmobacter sp.]|uniref:S-layer homology domain-containing protein n=1 Tax=Dysosmobacter sp. TaxID=2591382 RepID=UPI002A846DB5|nr:S-layer homology domain-containing protein [Dysosmobacter sp.]MDY3282355.1 hypothetical protein [Dysosmobacter sp.]